MAKDRLAEYLQLADAFQWGHPPVAGSAFASGTRENGGIWWRETGDLFLAAAFDHLSAFNTLLHGPIVPRLAGYGVLRNCAEAAAVAWWIVDPTVPEQDRVQPGFEERLYANHASTNLVEPENMVLHLEARKAIVAAAGEQGLTEVEDTHKKITNFGRPRPGISDLLTRMLPLRPANSKLTDGEYLWRTLSAYSHSEVWTSAAGLPEAVDDIKPRVLVVNLETLLLAATLTLMAYNTAFDRRMEVAGHPDWRNVQKPISLL